MLPHIVKDYATEKGVPICLHENRFFRMMFNGYFHYLDPVRYARGAVIVPRFANGDLLLVRLRRAPAIGMSVEFPRGGADAGETEQQTARRELQEETGFDVPLEHVVHLGRVAPDTATINGGSELFLIEIPADATGGEFDRDEIDQPLRVSEAEFCAMAARGEIVDAMTLAAWGRMRMYLETGTPAT